MKGRPSCSTCHGREYHRREDACGDCDDVVLQAQDWLLSRCPGSVAGSGGHNAAFHAASSATHGFGLGRSDALAVMSAWNSLCSPPWSERELVHKVDQAMQHGGGESAGKLVWRRFSGGDAAAGGESRVSRPETPEPPLPDDLARVNRGAALPFSPAALRQVQRSDLGQVTPRWWMTRSRVPLDLIVTPEDYLEAVFRRGERVLIFDRLASQGEYLYEVGRGAFRLSSQRGGKAQRVDRLPVTGKEGLWYLCAPVTGQWYAQEGGKWSRRSGNAVTDWRHLVMESDEAPSEQWLNLVAQLPVKVVAIYGSGSRSWHVLCRVDADSKTAWDAVRRVMLPTFTRLGADPGCFSGVRLTRLPGAWREGTRGKSGEYVRYDKPRRQELIYLDRDPDGYPVGDRCLMAAG